MKLSRHTKAVLKYIAAALIIVGTVIPPAAPTIVQILMMIPAIIGWLIVMDAFLKVAHYEDLFEALEEKLEALDDAVDELAAKAEDVSTADTDTENTSDSSVDRTE